MRQAGWKNVACARGKRPPTTNSSARPGPARRSPRQALHFTSLAHCSLHGFVQWQQELQGHHSHAFTASGADLTSPPPHSFILAYEELEINPPPVCTTR